MDMAAVGGSRASKKCTFQSFVVESRKKKKVRDGFQFFENQFSGVSQRLQPMTVEEGFSRVTE